MKFFIFAFSLFFSVLCSAASDSVGVFHRPDKVIILISDNMNGRLFNFLVAANFVVGTPWETQNSDFRISCGMNPFKVGCTLVLKPSERVMIGERDVNFQTSLSDFGSKSQDVLSVDFESSMQDKLALSLDEGVMSLYATKK